MRNRFRWIKLVARHIYRRIMAVLKPFCRAATGLGIVFALALLVLAFCGNLPYWYVLAGLLAGPLAYAVGWVCSVIRGIANTGKSRLKSRTGVFVDVTDRLRNMEKQDVKVLAGTYQYRSGADEFSFLMASGAAKATVEPGCGCFAFFEPDYFQTQLAQCRTGKRDLVLDADLKHFMVFFVFDKALSAQVRAHTRYTAGRGAYRYSAEMTAMYTEVKHIDEVLLGITRTE